MTKVAIVGTQGIPATYGGFESLVENLTGDNCPADVSYTVFCSGKDMDTSLKHYKGAELKYVPLRANGIQSVPYDMISLFRCLRGYDAILLLGVSGGLFLPIFRVLCKTRLIINIDGQEYRRAKWNKFAKFILRISEKFAVRCADVVISDNKGIQDYVKETYGHDSELIAYGGDHVHRSMSDNEMAKILSDYGLSKGDYAVTVCRIEPENNSHLVLEAFASADKKLVYIGNWDHSDYSRSLKQRYSQIENIKLLDAIYDLDTLYALRSNAGLYVHGHSAGGTNPSLVEAMHFGMPIAAFDVVYNRETTEGAAYYFKNAEHLKEILEKDDLDGSAMKEIAMRRYTWGHISRQYVNLYNKS